MPKTMKVGPQGPPPGKGVKYHLQLQMFFLVISCTALENTFLGASPPFLHQTMYSGGIDFLGGLNFKIKIFPT